MRATAASPWAGPIAGFRPTWTGENEDEPNASIAGSDHRGCRVHRVARRRQLLGPRHGGGGDRRPVRWVPGECPEAGRLGAGGPAEPPVCTIAVVQPGPVRL